MNKLDLNFLGNCPICSATYQQGKTSVISKKDEAIVLHIDCVKCQSSVLLTLQSGLKGLVTTVGVPTDLKKSDFEMLKNSSKITSDDVLDLHTFLEKKDESEIKSRKKN